jgi:hypothetical protein
VPAPDHAPACQVRAVKRQWRRVPDSLVFCIDWISGGGSMTVQADVNGVRQTAVATVTVAAVCNSARRQRALAAEGLAVRQAPRDAVQEPAF